MKITASKKDDILKRKAEYDEKYAKYKARSDELRQKFNEAEFDVTDKIRDRILDILSGFDLLKFDVQVRRNWFSKVKDSVDVNIECRSGALKWDYAAKFNMQGELEKSTSSWSGMSATTAEEIESLRQTVEALDRLSKVDWKPIIQNVGLPDYEDYIDPENIEPEREDFQSQLRDAEFEEIMGKNKIIKVENYLDSPYWGNYLWVKVEGETPAFWKVYILPDSAVTDPVGGYSVEDYINGFDPYKVKKTKLIPVEPIEIEEI